jgi:hypothetical protein
VNVEKVADRFFEFEGAAMGSALDLALAQDGEPALDEVQPRPGGRREVQVVAGVAGEPGLDGRRLVGAVVVHDQVNVELRRHALLDGAQELQELAAAMPPMQLADDLAGGQIQRREQGRGAIAHVVMAAPLGHAEGQRQQRLGAVQRLDLRLLVHTQHHGMGGRRQVQAHDVAHLVDEQRIGGQLEGLGAMRLQAKGPPDAQHGRLVQTAGLGHQPRAPVRGFLGSPLQRHRQHLFDLRIADPARLPRPRRIDQPVEPLLDEALPPLADRLQRHAQPLRHLRVRGPLRAAEHDARPQGERLRRPASPCPLDQAVVLFERQFQLRQRSSGTHDCLLATNLP